MELTLGPVLTQMGRDDMIRFYDEVADLAVNTVYLGEVVCSKRGSLTVDDIGLIGESLERAGKKVVVSTLAIVTSDEELALIRDLAALPFAIEANDMSVFNIVDAAKKEVLAGPHLLTYNTAGVAFLNNLGVKRFSFPVELPRESIKYNIDNTGIDAEVFGFGRVPLAFSWRCYSARASGRTRSECQLDCARHRGGIEIKTLHGEPVFTLNGTSILSARAVCLVEFIDDLKEMGVKAFRVSPVPESSARVVKALSDRIEGRIDTREALEVLKECAGTGFCNGWYHKRPGKELLALEAAAGLARAAMK